MDQLDNDQTDADKITTDNCYKEIHDSNISEDVPDDCGETNILIVDDTNIFCKKVDLNDFKNINKLKLEQLQILANKYNVAIQTESKGKIKNKTKGQLVDDLKKICTI